MSDTSIIDVLLRLNDASPIKIGQILTGNSTQFTFLFAAEVKKADGRHVFGKVCTGMSVERRLSSPSHSKSDGLFERDNGILQ